MTIRKIFFFLFFISLKTFSQEESCSGTSNKEAQKLYEKGTDKKKYEKEQRMSFLKKCLEEEPDYVDANFAYAQERIRTINTDGGTYKSIEEYLLKVVTLCPKYHSDPYYFLGFSYYEQEKYEDAIKYLEQFVNFSDEDDKKFSKKDYESYLYNAKQMLKYAKFYQEIFAHPVPFEPTVLDGISTIKDEYLPIISPDNQYAFFTRRLRHQTKAEIFITDKEIEVFYSSQRKNGKFDEGQPLESPFNQNSNEGGASLSIDNKHLYYTICKDEGGVQINCDIYYSDFVDGRWTDIKKLGKVNDPEAWDSQPSVSADGNTIYFASDRKGGLGSIDIWMTKKDVKTGEWGTPINLGPKINTSGKEKSPFMHSDSETLYFSSDGHPGVGGFDIFYVKKDDNGEWKEPQNIGYPINTESDDLGFFVSTDGHYGYFATNTKSKVKGKTVGGWDVYSFELYKEARPEEVAFIKDTLKDANGQAFVGKVDIEITNLATKEKQAVVVDTTTGEFTTIVNRKKGADFLITAKKEGYTFSSQIVKTVAVEQNKIKPSPVKMEISPVEPNKSFTLNNIYYKTNSAELMPESKAVVEEFVTYLKENPTIKIEIHGHTDNVGNEKDNLALSADRAFTVYEMILDSGIDKSRLIAFKGFGSSNPTSENSTEQGRAKNRRTEFFIVEK